VLRLRERIVAQVDAVDEGEVAEPLGLPANLGDERDWLPQPGGRSVRMPGASRSMAPDSVARVKARAMSD
jgi:hypothetical protein